jgi:LuxR family transcriptional regulator, maltose regulon positive regulatory protein
LQPWFDSVRGGGDVGGALLAGLPVLERLALADWGTRLAAADRELLARLFETMRSAQVGRAEPELTASPRPVLSNAALQGLSEREREVLARMAAGDSNKLIARAFDLSPHTVKRHVANILDKLAVATRGQAAARWREHATHY